MRYAFILCCRWYGPEGAAAARGETVDYDPLRLAIAVSEQAADRLDLPRDTSMEGANSLLAARMGWLHDTQAKLEEKFGWEHEVNGFDGKDYIVDVFSTHVLDTAEQAMTLASAWRQAIIAKAEGSAEGISEICAIGEAGIENQDVDTIFADVREAFYFDPEFYGLTPVNDLL